MHNIRRKIIIIWHTAESERLLYAVLSRLCLPCSEYLHFVFDPKTLHKRQTIRYYIILSRSKNAFVWLGKTTAVVSKGFSCYSIYEAALSKLAVKRVRNRQVSSTELQVLIRTHALTHYMNNIQNIYYIYVSTSCVCIYIFLIYMRVFERVQKKSDRRRRNCVLNIYIGILKITTI